MSNAYNASLQENFELTVLGSIYRHLEADKDKINGDIDLLLRAEYALTLGAFDDYLHQVMLEHMVKMFALELDATNAFNMFKIPMNLVLDIIKEKEIKRRKYAFRNCVSDIIRHNSYLSGKGISEVKQMIGINNNIWEASGKELGITADEVKTAFNKAVWRRNAIVHEMDMNKSSGSKNPITKGDVDELIKLVLVIRSCIEKESSEIIKKATQTDI